MSPENPYPTPEDDCYKVTKYLIKNYQDYKFDLEKVVLIGDSAGKSK